jgi:RNA polymerase sigma-70 factor (ECF subfamily)
MTSKITKQYFLYKAGKLDPDAFARVYDLYVKKIYRYVYFKVSSVQEAQDITSNVFLKAWEYLLSEEREVENLGALFYKIARNLVIDFYRKKEHSDLTEDMDSIKYDIVSEKKFNDVYQNLDVKFKTQEVFGALEKLNDLYKEIIILKYVDQLSTKEIASIINKSKGATRVLVHRALAVLKRLLEE